MKKKISRGEMLKKIEEFFRREDFRAEDARKIKRLAMKYRLPLRKYRRFFCKRCFSRLMGKTRVSRDYKSVICVNCGYLNRFLIGRE